MSTEIKLKKKALGRRFKAIIMPMCSGRSVLTDHMNSTKSGDKKNTIYIDIDARVGSDEKVNIKEILLRDYQEYHNFRIVLVTSNIKSIKQYGIESSKCYYYYPSTMLSLVFMSNRELITKNQIFRDSSWDSWLEIPKFNGRSKPKKQANNFSLCRERGLSQDSSLKYQLGHNRSELYDDEMSSICKSRDAVIGIKKSKMYSSFKELFDLISKDIYNK